MMCPKIIALASVLLAGCSGLNGSGAVDATFFIDECPPGTDIDLSGYRFEADWLTTERFSGVLIVMIQDFRVRVEETDGLAARIEMRKLIDDGILRLDTATDRIVRVNPSAPIVLDLATEGGLANASLSLFQTCPNYPTFHATSGTLTFTEFGIAGDPEDTGRGELLAGTITGTIAQSNDLTIPAGVVRAQFDFEPPTRPTTYFK